MTPGGRLGSAQMGAVTPDNGTLAAVADSIAPDPRLSSHSRFAQRLRRRYAGELALLPPGRPTRALMAGTYETLCARGNDTGTALRILRQLVMERLIGLDCDEQAPLAVVT